jgi:lysozyme
MNEQELQAWIKNCEDLKTHPYLDTTNHVTIGWGRNLDNGISLDEAELMFQNDFKRAANELRGYVWYVQQPVGVQCALVNMNFNLGIDKLLGFKKMIVALLAKDYTTAALEALDSKWANQVHKRANDIAVMIRAGK